MLIGHLSLGWERCAGLREGASGQCRCDQPRQHPATCDHRGAPGSSRTSAVDACARLSKLVEVMLARVEQHAIAPMFTLIAMQYRLVRAPRPVAATGCRALLGGANAAHRVDVAGADPMLIAVRGLAGRMVQVVEMTVVQVVDIAATASRDASKTPAALGRGWLAWCHSRSWLSAGQVNG